MAECQNLSKCPFFNDQMANMPALAELTKKQLCRTAYENCARYLVSKALGSTFVPKDLFPTQVERAREIIAMEQGIVR